MIIRPTASDKINQQSFDATASTLNFIMIAFNLMSLFKQVIIKDKIRPTLKNIRYSSLGIDSHITKNGKDKILKMLMNIKRRSWITTLRQNAAAIQPPFINIVKV
jgi:hypothetical protein